MLPCRRAGRTCWEQKRTLCRLFGQGSRNLFGVTRTGVESGSHRSAADGKFVHQRQRISDLLTGDSQLIGPAGDLLPEGQGGGVLQVSAADLDDVVEGGGLLVEALSQRIDGGQQSIMALAGAGDVNGGGERIVGALSVVDVIVRMHRTLATERLPETLVGAVGDHLVAVHVGLGAGTGLVDDQRKMIVEITGDHFFGGTLDGAADLLGDATEFGVDPGGSLLDEPHRTDHRPTHPLLADAEVLQ